MAESSSAEHGQSSRLAFSCDLAEARSTARTLRNFLAGQGLEDADLFACELCLTEACNNAVEYADEAGRREPIVAEAICRRTGVELRVTDHTPGFAWPGRLATPTPDRERGRGLFIIQSLMDDVRYFRGAGENTLVMRKAINVQRAPLPAAAHVEIASLRRRLADRERTLNGMARDLCFRSESLAAIFRCCAELGRTNDLEGFGQRLLSDLLHLTAADWFVLRLASPDQARLTVFAASAPELRAPPLALAGPDSTSAEATSALRHSEVRFEARTPEAREDPLREAGSDSTGLVHPLFFGEVLVGTLAVGRKTCSPEFSELQSEVIRTFAEFLAIQIASKRHQDEQVQSRLTARELDIARGIQRALLPKSLPQLRGFGLAGCCESARKVGGDFYDALPLSDHSLLLVMADVMGKGVPAAMFATILRSVVHAMSAQGSRPGALLAQLNRLLYPELSAVNMFITAQLVFLDLDQRQLVTASAGHCPALLVSSAGASVRAVTTNGLPLGILPEVTYRETTAMLEEPAIFLLHTDGLTESWNSSGEMFGQARLMSWLRDRGQRPHTAEQLRDALAAELGRFRGGAPLLDDQAFLILAEEKSSPHPHRAVSPRLAFWKNAPAKSSNPPQLVEP